MRGHRVIQGGVSGPEAPSSRCGGAFSADQFSAAETAAKSMRLMLGPQKLENPPYAAFPMIARGEAQMLLRTSAGTIPVRGVKPGDMNALTC
jgi:hypothetical protein